MRSPTSEPDDTSNDSATMDRDGGRNGLVWAGVTMAVAGGEGGGGGAVGRGGCGGECGGKILHILPSWLAHRKG